MALDATHRGGGNLMSLGGLLVAQDGSARFKGGGEGLVSGLAVLRAAVADGGDGEGEAGLLGLQDQGVNVGAEAEGLGRLAGGGGVEVEVSRGLEQFLGAGVVQRLDGVIDDAVGDDVGLDDGLHGYW